jgi:hypothetical protein
MNQFTAPKVFQAKPSNFKKQLAFAAFAAGAIAFTLAVTGVIGAANGGPFFAGGLVAMVLAYRFWTMQVRDGPMAVTFDGSGITIANRSASNTIPWAELESIRYRVWRGGYYWEFKSHNRKKTLDYYVDGLTAAQLDELRETISSLQLPDVRVEPFPAQLGFIGAAR